MPVGEVRRSQLITTYGVGAVLALEDEAFMVLGIDRWDVDGPTMHEPRLERELRVQGFVVPPATNGNDVPVVRFPVWHSCPSCRKLAEHNKFTAYHRNQCNVCGVPLIPSRFVMVCARGHIDDFPYFQWVHAGHKGRSDKHELRIESAGNTASLAAIVISCSCGAVASMEGAFGRQALASITRCRGRRPWLSSDEDPCDETPRTLQRGASNVWFPVVRSAISIPPWSEGAYKLVNRYWTALKAIPEFALADTIDNMRIAAEGEYAVEDLVAAVVQRKAREEGREEPDAPLKEQEYEALVRGKGERSRLQEFVCTPAASIGRVAEDYFDKVMLVKRLREVRALAEFTRLHPPGPTDPRERRAPLAEQPTGWLPGVEVTGEGVFLRLRADRLAAWEENATVIDRSEQIKSNYAQRFADAGVPPDREISPRLLLIHSLAHALINQWALDSGYPAASLRERLYVSDDMAGLLIYTATSDSAGSLGGVVAQADDGRLDGALSEAVTRSSWCSADPLCIETEAAGVDALNLAACHACLLLPEVSCEEMNVLLDRALLVGLPGEPEVGFFRALVPS
jgi:hypothetical protein